MIENLDNYRIGWELIDFNDYSYWGGYKAVVVQFSRGCPHLCSYCGQRGYWSRWRHRDPVLFAKEIARLHKEHGVQLFNFADENFSTSKRVWREFLEALIAENIDVRLVASMRADDIVRDADILHLYKKAGFERFLLGMEHTDAETLAKIKKGGSPKTDQQAILLLRQHGILSLATWVVGFNEETDKSLWQGFKQLLMYDPDQIQMLYSTPHRWTEFGQSVAKHYIVQPNLRLWDYKHQVLSIPNLAPWRLFLWVKSIEIMMQIRPRALKRLLFHPDAKIRQGMRWYYRMGRRVWFHEVYHFLFKDKRVKPSQTLEDYWGKQSFAVEEDVLQRIRLVKKCTDKAEAS
jgi:anaerobic magnesium-protoporphyrin IX monomethyl ester cyclase